MCEDEKVDTQKKNEDSLFLNLQSKYGRISKKRSSLPSQENASLIANLTQKNDYEGAAGNCNGEESEGSSEDENQTKKKRQMRGSVDATAKRKKRKKFGWKEKNLISIEEGIEVDEEILLEGDDKMECFLSEESDVCDGAAIGTEKTFQRQLSGTMEKEAKGRYKLKRQVSVGRVNMEIKIPWSVSSKKDLASSMSFGEDGVNEKRSISQAKRHRSSQSMVRSVKLPNRSGKGGGSSSPNFTCI